MRLDEIQAELLKLEAADERDAAGKLLGLHPALRIAGAGSSRIAVGAAPRDGFPQIIKVAWKPRGIFENELEASVWGAAGPELRALLCPSELLEGGLLRQPRCELIRFEDLPREAGESLVADLASFGISDGAVNLGLLGDRIVCYDYAVVSPALYSKLARNTQIRQL